MTHAPASIDQIGPVLGRNADPVPLRDGIAPSAGDGGDGRRASEVLNDSAAIGHADNMTNRLSLRKPNLGRQNVSRASAILSAHHRFMKNPYYLEVSRRLSAALTETGIRSAADLAKHMQVGESRARNWCNGTSPPPVPEALRLRRLLGITLDWLFAGDPRGMDQGKFIRLEAIAKGIEVPDLPLVAAAEPEPAGSGSVAGLADLANGSEAASVPGKPKTKRSARRSMRPTNS